MDPLQSMNSLQLDLLKEVGNIGAGNAATALSQLVNRKIEMRVPTVRIVSFNEISNIVGGAENLVASVFLRIEGELTGGMLFILPNEQANYLVGQLLGDSKLTFTNPPYPEIALSAFQEMGNILAGSYLSALSDFSNLKLTPSVPAVAIDMFGAIITYGLLEISQVSDYAIVIDTILNDTDSSNKLNNVKGHLLLLPDPEAYSKLFKTLGV